MSGNGILNACEKLGVSIGSTKSTQRVSPSGSTGEEREFRRDGFKISNFNLKFSTIAVFLVGAPSPAISKSRLFEISSSPFL